MMKKGQVIQVFHDPITQENVEGDARLVACLDQDFGQVEQGTLQRWRVRFVGERHSFERTILMRESA